MIKIYIFLIFFVFLNFSSPVNGEEKVLLCKLNYGISGENDETDIEFKNLSIIDQDQVLYLDLNKQWLSVESQKDFDDGSSGYSKSEFIEKDSTIFSMSYLETNGSLIRKNIIELNRYTGFVKHEFRTSAETMYRTGRCSLSKGKRLF